MSHAKHRQSEIRVQNKIFVLFELFVFKKKLVVKRSRGQKIVIRERIKKRSACQIDSCYS